MADGTHAPGSSGPARRYWLAAAALAAAALLAGCAGTPAGGGGDGLAPAAPTTTAPPRACTEIGCQSSLTMRSPRLAALLAGPRALTVTACLDRDCLSAPIRAGRCAGLGALLGNGLECADRAVVLLPARDDLGEGSHSARLTLKAGPAVLLDEQVDGIRFERLQPNGPTCPPRCWTAVVKL
jgi:hypothetical protein